MQRWATMDWTATKIPSVLPARPRRAPAPIGGGKARADTTPAGGEQASGGGGCPAAARAGRCAHVPCAARRNKAEGTTPAHRFAINTNHLSARPVGHSA